MKRKLCLMATAVALASFCLAQPETGNYRQQASSNTYLGITWGPGWSKQHTNYAFIFETPFQPARVFSFGLQYGFPVSEALAGQAELCLTQHGYRLEETTYDSGIEINAKVDARIRYLELPLSFVYRIPVGSQGFELAAMPGISLGYAVSGKVVAQGKGESATRKVFTRLTEEVPVKDAAFADRLDAALLLGAQAAFNFGNGAAFVEARYHFGVLNLERNAEYIINEGGDKAFNRSFLLRLGYRYAL